MERVKLAVFPLLAALLLALPGCAAAPSPTQLTALVAGNLDTLYRGQAEEEYLLLTGADAGQVESAYEQGLAREAAFFCRYFDVEDPDEALLGEVADLYRKIYPLALYTVEDAVKESRDVYAARVQVTPVGVFASVLSDPAEMQAAFAEAHRGADLSAMTPAEKAAYGADWARTVMAAVRLRLPGAGYRDPVNFTVHVERGEDGVWRVNADDLRQVDEAVIYYP